jgi:hypothetical protein
VEANAARGLTARLTHRILGGLCAAVLCLSASILCLSANAQSTSGTTTSSSTLPVAHGTIATAAPVTYDNTYEVFGGLSYMRFKAGPYLVQGMNMGGGELMGTYWLHNGAGRYIAPNRLGFDADYRFEAGTTPVAVNAYNLNRTLVYQNILMGGVSLRGPRNQFFATNLHVLAGRSWANFSHGTLPAAPPQAVGLYTDRSAFISAIGMSLDINQSKHWAVRLSPDLMLSRFGTYTLTDIAIGGGVLYRFGK